jgi:predicted CopG family antitoxin
MVMMFEPTENPQPILLKRKKYLTKESSKTITVSCQVHERLLRRRLYPNETIAQVLDRLIINDVLVFDLYYDKNQVKDTTSVNVSLIAQQKLKELKINNNLKSMNEVLWRLMSNDANR